MQDIPEIIERNTVHSGFFDLHIDTVKKKEKSPMHFTVVGTKVEATAIIATDKEGKYIITREYRHPIRKFVYSIPGGRVEPNEDLKVAAKRELREETGYEAKEILKLEEYFPMPAICDQRITLYVATNCTKVHQTHLDIFEVIETHLFTKDELFQLLKDGAPIDGILASSLFYNQLHS